MVKPNDYGLVLAAWAAGHAKTMGPSHGLVREALGVADLIEHERPDTARILRDCAAEIVQLRGDDA